MVSSGDEVFFKEYLSDGTWLGSITPVTTCSRDFASLFPDVCLVVAECTGETGATGFETADNGRDTALQFANSNSNSLDLLTRKDTAEVSPGEQRGFH